MCLAVAYTPQSSLVIAAIMSENFFFLFKSLEHNNYYRI